jgi:hypothetical protein
MMQNVAASLLRDFQVVLNDPCYCWEHQAALRAGVPARIRSTSPEPKDGLSPYEYKTTYQIQSVLKRYRFRNDIYTDDELEDKAINSFLETQNRLQKQDLACLSSQAQTVLDVAASYIAKIIGVYNDEECRDLSRFGKKASVGIPARKACEAERWAIPISGSLDQILWFSAEMHGIDSVREYLAGQLDSDPQGSIFQEVDSLRLTLVPKTFKSLRAIMPNTTIGSYQSYGLGEMLRKRLQRNGYNIRTLQQRHKLLAKSASMDGLHVTADLSSASDSISVALVERLFPKDWYDILIANRIGNVTLPNDTVVQSLTFCTMGIGYTFPLQTLVFLALLKSIEVVCCSRNGLDKRLISVYGDDMIYHHRMHEHVVRLFEELGFVINIDKTYHEGNFRESCGGDYYHGVDVRPFQPRNGPANVSSKAYEAMLYKYINGLLMRWSEHEIGMTLNYLMSELSRVVQKAKVVPGDYPDDAGIKCHYLGCHSFLTAYDSLKPKHVGNGVYRFTFLRLTPDKRKEVRHEPYLWLGLRGGDRFTDSFGDQRHQDYPESMVAAVIAVYTGISGYVSPLSKVVDTPIVTFRDNTGRRLRRTSTCVTVSHTGRYACQSGFSCFEDRR